MPIANGKRAPATEPRCLPSRAARPTSFQPVPFVLDQKDLQRASTTAAAGVVRTAAGASAEAPAVKPHHAQLDLGKSFVDDAVFLSGVEDIMNARCCDQKVMELSRDVQRGVGGGYVEFTCGGCGWRGCANRSALLPRGEGKGGKLKRGPLQEANTVSAVNAAIGAGFGNARLSTFLLGFGAKPLPVGTFYNSAGKVEEAHSDLLASEIKINHEQEMKMKIREECGVYGKD